MIAKSKKTNGGEVHGKAKTATAARTLPPLLVNIMQDGKVVDVVELNDPREAFCRSYNELQSGYLLNLKTSAEVAAGGNAPSLVAMPPAAAEAIGD